MRKSGNVQRRRKYSAGILAFVLIMVIGLFSESFSMVSHAESQAKVKANTAYIRREPSASSEALGSTEKDKVISVTGQVKGSDGYTWYQTFVNSETLGYIRSDLVEITDGTTPPALTGTTTQPPAATPTPTPTPPAGNSNETPATVTAVNPVSATVSGGSSVRIRSNASTTSTIVEKVSNGLALTVTGTANGSDGNVWYKVSCNSNGSEIEGFIRSDFVTLSGELTPFTEPTEPENPTEPTEPTEPAEPEPPQVNKDYDTELIDGKWYLIDRLKGQQHDIQGLFDKVTNNYNAYQEAEKTAKMEKVIIIILVFLVVAASAVIALLIFKIKDMTDDAYFNEVESETMRRRSAPRSQGGSQKVMHTVGSGRTGEGRAAGQRSGGARPAGSGQGGQRPGGVRPAGAASGGQSGQRPGGARPAGAASGGGQGGQRPGGARPAGTVSGGGQGGQRPGGARPAGAVSGGGQGGQRPMGARPAGTRPVESGQRPMGARPAEAGQGSGQRPGGTRSAGGAQRSGNAEQSWQSRNFMADDDDEFEFEFLNYDGDEE